MDNPPILAASNDQRWGSLPDRKPQGSSEDEAGSYRGPPRSNRHPLPGQSLHSGRPPPPPFVPFDLRVGFTGGDDDEAVIDSIPGARKNPLWISPREMKVNIKNVEESARIRATIIQADLVRFGISFDTNVQISALESNPPQELFQKPLRPRRTNFNLPRKFDFFAHLAPYPDIYFEIAKHMRPASLVNLYSLSKPFQNAVKDNLAHVVLMAAACQAPESARVYLFHMYPELCVPDPVGRPDPRKDNATRWIPSLRWLTMVVHRDKCVRDILATFARKGHKTPDSMPLSLKKMWLLMDVATSIHRTNMMNSRVFTDKDLFNIQLFVVKLDMRLNSPNEQPGANNLRRIFLGQRSLTPLCNFLKNPSSYHEVALTRLAIRYRFNSRSSVRHLPIFNIPPEEIGVYNLEGWGMGRQHLLRPDELVIQESTWRNLGLKDHIRSMMRYGYYDENTGERLVITEEEKYMSDDEESELAAYEDGVDDADVGEDPELTDDEDTLIGNSSGLDNGITMSSEQHGL